MSIILYKSAILSQLEQLPYFTIEAVKQLIDATKVTDSTLRTALFRWVKNGDLITLKKGVYMTREFYLLHRSKSEFASMVSAILIPQSYLSLTYILQRTGSLTDVTYPFTAVTLKQTRVIVNQLGTYTYRHIKPDLYMGFTIVNIFGIPVAQATRAKALFDFFYFRTVNLSATQPAIHLAEELRLNLDDFSSDDIKEFESYVERSQSRKMSAIAERLMRETWQH